MDRIYRTYAREVYDYLLAQTHSPELAEELTQETFYQAVRCADKFDGSCRVSTWLCGIARNLLLAHWRKEKNRAVPLTGEECGGLSTEEQVLSEAGRADIVSAMHRLEEPGREILYLRLFGELPFRDIGRVFGKSENWARVTYYRAKQKLIEEMKQNGR